MMVVCFPKLFLGSVVLRGDEMISIWVLVLGSKVAQGSRSSFSNCLFTSVINFVRDDGMCILFHLLCYFLFVCLCLFSSVFSLIVSLLKEASHVTWVVMWPGSSDGQEERINSSLSVVIDVVTSSFCCAPVSPICYTHKRNLLTEHSPVC